MGGPEKLRQQLQAGRKQCHLKDLWEIANPQVGLWEMPVVNNRSNSPFQ